MQLSTISSAARRRVARSIPLVVVVGLIGQNAWAADTLLPVQLSQREVAFARYVAMHGEPDPLPESGTVGVFIEGSLLDLYKSAVLIGVRAPAEDERSRLLIIQIAGDGTVAEEVINRYWTVRQHLDFLPFSSVAITPANYKFHFDGEVKTGGALAYVYDVRPKKKRRGLVVGRLWIDASTGAEVEFSGYVVHMPEASDAGRVDVARETRLLNGLAIGRISHVTWTAPLLGRVQVTVTEVALNAESITPTNCPRGFVRSPQSDFLSQSGALLKK